MRGNTDNNVKSEDTEGNVYRCTVQCLIMSPNEDKFLVGTKPKSCNKDFDFPVQGGINKGGGDILVSAERAQCGRR